NAVVHGCTIGDGSLIGMGAVVLNGARIGAGCLVAGGAVVLEGADIPPGSLVAGVPGKVRRELTDQERAGLLQNAAVYREQHLGEHVEATLACRGTTPWSRLRSSSSGPTRTAPTAAGPRGRRTGSSARSGGSPRGCRGSRTASTRCR